MKHIVTGMLFLCIPLYKMLIADGGKRKRFTLDDIFKGAMGKKIKEVDAYILRSAAFAQPILTYLRDVVHQVCPDAEEKIKWGFPHFDYLDDMMCSMAAFKQHCAFSFWKAPIMKDKSLLDTAQSESAMGHLGKIRSEKDLPSKKKLEAWIRDAMALNEMGMKVPARTPMAGKKELNVPDYFIAALIKNKKAEAYFNQLPYSHKKEYVQWITEAKTETTRLKRLSSAIEWLSEQKSRNWKYETK